MKSLGKKIGFGYAVIIFITVILTTYAIYQIRQLSRPIDRILKEKYKNVNAAEQLRESLVQQDLALFNVIENGFDSSAVLTFNFHVNEFYNWHQKAIAGIALPEEPVLLDSMMHAFLDFQSRADTLFFSDSIPGMLSVPYHCRKSPK